MILAHKRNCIVQNGSSLFFGVTTATAEKLQMFTPCESRWIESLGSTWQRGAIHDANRCLMYDRSLDTPEGDMIPHEKWQLSWVKWRCNLGIQAVRLSSFLLLNPPSSAAFSHLTYQHYPLAISHRDLPVQNDVQQPTVKLPGGNPIKAIQNPQLISIPKIFQVFFWSKINNAYSWRGKPTHNKKQSHIFPEPQPPPPSIPIASWYISINIPSKWLGKPTK